MQWRKPRRSIPSCSWSWEM